jgi:phytoene dehydrogenase-like protein
MALADSGVSVTVLEARDRVGGRVWSPRLDNGEVVEMGAEWIMPGDYELFALAERFGEPLAEAGIDYLRRLKWLKIIFVMWQRRVPYSETHHLATMARQHLRQKAA